MNVHHLKSLYISIIALLLFSVSSYGYKNTYAVIIGVADYKYFPPGPGGDLTFTVNDAYKMNQFLMSGYLLI